MFSLSATLFVQHRCKFSLGVARWSHVAQFAIVLHRRLMKLEQFMYFLYIFFPVLHKHGVPYGGIDDRYLCQYAIVDMLLYQFEYEFKVTTLTIEGYSRFDSATVTLTS